MQYTIITTTATFGVDGTRWTFDAQDDLYVYSDDQDDPVATVDSEQFVAILNSDHGIDDADDLADIAPGVTAEVERAVRDALHDVDSIIH